MSDFFFRIDSDFAGERIDKTLSDLCSDFTRSHIQHIIDDGEVRVNGKPVPKSFRVSIGDEISFPSISSVLTTAPVMWPTATAPTPLPT